MTALSPARKAALAVVSERRRRDARVRELLRTSAAVEALDARDRALCTRLACGAVLAEGALDAAINAQLKRGAKLEPRVRDALRIAAFELLYLSTPSEAAVSQGVELVRSVQPRAAGLANAVLRKIACDVLGAGGDVPFAAGAPARACGGEGRRRITALTPDDESNAPARLARQAVCFAKSDPARQPESSSRNPEPSPRHPEPKAKDLSRPNPLPAWLAEYVDCARVLEPPTPSVAGFSPEAKQLLVEAGCEPVEGPLPRSFVLGAPSKLAKSKLVEKCLVAPCDLAAQEVALAAAPTPGERVLEIGQGRGTKTLLLMAAAQAAGGPCDVTAVELDPAKSALAARRMETAGIADHVRCFAADARELATRDDLGLFGLVFVDAPCSGTGTIRRHPEIAWSLDPASVPALAELQLELLNAASACVAPGGRLLYATCSVLPTENKQVVGAFLNDHPDFALDHMGATSDYGSDTHFWARLLRR